VYDRRRLPLPGELAAGSYRLDIVLYRRATLEEVGRTTFEGVTLERTP
jgi:hypothetical protein